MKYLVEQSGLPIIQSYPKKLQPGDDYDEFCRLDEIRQNITEFVDYGGSLYIASANTGNGKTSWAVKLLMKYFNDIWAGNGFRRRGMFVHVPTALMKLKDFNGTDIQEYRESLINTELVVFDEIGGTRFTEYDEMMLLSVIDARLMQGKSNIYTSNQPTMHNLESVIGARIASRIFNTSELVVLKGKDRRHGTTATDKQNYSKQRC